MSGIKKLYLAICAVFAVGFWMFFYEEGATIDSKDYIMAVRFDYSDGVRSVTYEAPQLKKDEADAVLQNPQTVESTQISYYPQFVDSYRNVSEKEADFHHIKLILLTKNIVENEQEFRLFLEFLHEQNVFAENVLVFIDGSEEGLLNGEEGSLGDYIEKLWQQEMKKQENQMVNVAKLLASYYNANQTIFLPVLGEEKTVVGYDALCCGKVVDYKEKGDMFLLFLANGYKCCDPVYFQDIYCETLEQDQNFSLEVSGIHRQFKFDETDGRITAQMNLLIKGNAKNYTGERLSDSSKLYNYSELLSLCLEQKLQDMADASTGKDLFNSYYELSNKNRSLWAKYRNSYEDYAQRLHVNVTVKMDFTE